MYAQGYSFHKMHTVYVQQRENPEAQRTQNLSLKRDSIHFLSPMTHGSHVSWCNIES
jgi:hypothetical protein